MRARQGREPAKPRARSRDFRARARPPGSRAATTHLRGAMRDAASPASDRGMRTFGSRANRPSRACFSIAKASKRSTPIASASGWRRCLRTSTSAPTMARTSIRTGLRKSPMTRCWRRPTTCWAMAAAQFSTRRSRGRRTGNSRSRLLRGARYRCCSSNALSDPDEAIRRLNERAIEQRGKFRTRRRRSTSSSAPSSSRFASFRLETTCESTPLAIANTSSLKSRMRSSTLVAS